MLGFSNGDEKVFDVSPYLGGGKFSELRDSSLFSSVMVKYDSIEWAIASISIPNSYTKKAFEDAHKPS